MSLSDQLDSAATTWMRENVATMLPQPDCVYHYTSADGLYGILRSGAMWGTNYAFMNDRSEFQYGIELGQGCLASAISALPDGGERRAIGLAQKVLAALPRDVYLTCFCEEADLLSQWRGYGTQNGRYCIEFDSKRLPIVPGVSPLSNVLYERNMHLALLTRMIEIYQTAMSSPPISNEQDIRAAASALALASIPVLTRFKDFTFREEKEWRCARIAWETDPENLEFSSGDGIMKPHHTLVKSSGRLPIKRIIAGASKSDLQSVRSAQLMLRKFGYSETVEVIPSRVPLQA